MPGCRTSRTRGGFPPLRLCTASGTLGHSRVPQPGDVGHQGSDNTRDTPPGQERENNQRCDDEREGQGRQQRQAPNATCQDAGRDIWSHGMSTLHDNLRTRGACRADGIRTGARGRQVELGPRRATFQDAHGVGEPVDRTGCGKVLAPADPVLEQIGSPNTDEDEEDQAAGLHKPKVRGVLRPYSGRASVCR